MTERARLRALRLIGFKSFAERTFIEFGPGISAIVGPNGSGKSNLADALRWTLGEQGRLLRTRRSEDVIFAGSSSRRAIGMADVTIMLENGDRLLPVDYGEVEIGRRLYRSGENEYLLNRQRVRLRDLNELLDAGNLADNAFLFIGQGMVDQALALRPEERRPLFEEAAGVRRHERRRRQAEGQLAEAELNLERLRDLLGELRPQARRLAAQAEQLNARRSAGHELAEALVANARARWFELARLAREAQGRLDEAHADADHEMAALRSAEETIDGLTRELATRAEAEQRQRAELDRVRATAVDMRLREMRLATERDGAERDARRLTDERSAAEQRLSAARRTLAEPLPAEDDVLTSQLASVEREMKRLESTTAQSDTSAVVQDASARRAAATAELDRLRTRRSAALAALQAARQRQVGAEDAGDHAARAAAAADQRDTALEAENGAENELRSARLAHERALQTRDTAARALADARAEAAAGQARVAGLEAALAAADNTALTRAARSRGGSLLAEGLEVEADLRPAVAAVLGDALGGVAVPEQHVGGLRQAGGVLYVTESAGGRRATTSSATETIVAAAVAAGGDRLTAAIRRDPQGHVSRLLARSVWVPGLDDALAMRSLLVPGWSIVTRDGELVEESGLIRLGAGPNVLDQGAALADERRRLEQVVAQLEARQAEVDRAAGDVARAEGAVRTTRDRLAEARSARQTADEAARSAGRRAEHSARESAWAAAQVDQASAEVESLQAAIVELEGQLAELEGQLAETLPPPTGNAATAGHAAMRRLAGLGDRQRQLAAKLAEQRQRRQAADESRRRAEIGVALDEQRLAALEGEHEGAVARRHQLDAELEALAVELAAAQEAQLRMEAALATTLGEGADERNQLLGAERAATAARERLRRAETRSRTAEVATMEARLHLEQLREQLLVELAGIGGDGLLALGVVGTGESSAASDGPAPVSAALIGEQLEEALTAASAEWQQLDTVEPAPPAGRLSALRRRFHELGAGNPFAVEEYAEVSQRLEGLEAQRADLDGAVASTRQLIADLSRLITEQFLSTFAALEGAFARRFEQLFNGGEAQLSLTAPDDPTTTGVEITARPPGKKRQPLAMLSGGERALTAVALLLAMLEVRPVPFCVLDEVDAALDEANIARFAAALRGLADRIQFIVITHNRGTIETADALYGVTIGDDAVSRIVSLRLAEWDGKSVDRGLGSVPIEPAAARSANG